MRFSAGIENAGDGPLDLRFDTRDPGHEMFQVLAHADGTTTKRRAGHFQFHQTHNHFHYTNIWAFQLFKVVDQDGGELERVGSGHKSGFCPADQGIAEWRRFDQARAWSTRSDCGMTYRPNRDGL